MIPGESPTPLGRLGSVPGGGKPGIPMGGEYEVNVPWLTTWLLFTVVVTGLKPVGLSPGGVNPGGVSPGPKFPELTGLVIYNISPSMVTKYIG